MKTTFCILFALFSFTTIAQQASEIDPKFVKLPRYNDFDAITTAITVPKPGMIVYNIQTKSNWYYNGVNWLDMTVGGVVAPLSLSSNSATVITGTTSATGEGGIKGVTTNNIVGFGVWGLATPTTPSATTYGVYGQNNSTNANGVGVGGIHNGTGWGGYFGGTNALKTFGKTYLDGAVSISNVNFLEFGKGLTKQEDNGKIAYNAFGEANTLSIVGGGIANDGSDRKIKMWANGGTIFNGGASFDKSVNIGSYNLDPIGKLTINSTNGSNLYPSIAIIDDSPNNETGGNILFSNGSGLHQFGMHAHFGLQSEPKYSYLTFSKNGNYHMRLRGDGNLGIGVIDPSAKLEVNGKIKISNDEVLPSAGNIRYNAFSNDFEGFNGVEWVSFTKHRGQKWGEHAVTQTEKIKPSTVATFDAFGKSIDCKANIMMASSATTAYVFYQNSLWQRLFVTEVGIQIPAGEDSQVATNGSNYFAVSVPTKTVGSNTYQGKIYIFKEGSGVIIQESTIVAADGAANDFFGYRIAMSGDYLIVGCKDKMISGVVQSGAVYIYKRNGTTWVQQLKYTPTNSGDVISFPKVSISGDYAAIGDENATNVSGYIYEGQVILLKRTGTTWNVETTLTTTGIPNYSGFGSCLKLDGDFLAIGVYHPVNDEKISIFHRDGSTWTKVAAYNPKADEYVESVDINNGTFCVGGNYRAYVYERIEEFNWTLSAELLPSADNSWGNFGLNSVGVLNNQIYIGDYPNEGGKIFFYKKTSN